MLVNCYKALIDSGADISLICYSTYKNIGDSYKTHLKSHYSQIKHSRWFPYDSPGNDSFTLEDSKIQIHPQFYNLQQSPGYRDYFWYRHTKEVFSFICLGQGKIVTYKEMENSSLTHETVIDRCQLAQLNHHLRYHHDTMVLHQLK